MDFGHSASGLTARSGHGHDKSLTIRPYAQLPSEQRPVLFYAGDGVSDLSAAAETDLLFAKKGHGASAAFTAVSNPPADTAADLIGYCVQRDIPFTVFEDWSSILEQVKEIVEGRTTVQEAAKRGYEAYRREGGGGVAE